MQCMQLSWKQEVCASGIYDSIANQSKHNPSHLIQSLCLHVREEDLLEVGLGL